MQTFINNQQIMVTEDMVVSLMLKLLPERTNHKDNTGATYKEMLPEFIRTSELFTELLSIPSDIEPEALLTSEFMYVPVLSTTVEKLFYELNRLVDMFIERHKL